MIAYRGGITVHGQVIIGANRYNSFSFLFDLSFFLSFHYLKLQVNFSSKLCLCQLWINLVKLSNNYVSNVSSSLSFPFSFVLTITSDSSVNLAGSFTNVQVELHNTSTLAVTSLSFINNGGLLNDATIKLQESVTLAITGILYIVL